MNQRENHIRGFAIESAAGNIQTFWRYRKQHNPLIWDNPKIKKGRNYTNLFDAIIMITFIGIIIFAFGKL